MNTVVVSAWTLHRARLACNAATHIVYKCGSTRSARKEEIRAALAPVTDALDRALALRPALPVRVTTAGLRAVCAAVSKASKLTHSSQLAVPDKRQALAHLARARRMLADCLQVDMFTGVAG